MDIRKPIGLLFTILGFILIGLGAIGDASAQAAKNVPVTININLIWGVVMVIFGLAMLIPALLCAKKEKCESGDSCSCKK